MKSTNLKPTHSQILAMDVLLLFFLYGMKFLVTVTKTKNWF